MGEAVKVGVIRAGAVGRACVLSMLRSGSCREIVLINRARERAAGVVTDMATAARSDPLDRTDRDYDALAGAAAHGRCRRA